MFTQTTPSLNSHRKRATASTMATLVVSLAVLLSSVIPQTHAQTKSTSATLPTSAASTPSRTTAAVPTSTSLPGSEGILAPRAFIGIASVAGDGMVFFQGGQLNSATVQYSGELFGLDISRPWNISSPAWIDLTIPKSGAGGPVVAGHSAVMSKDLSTLYVTAPSGSSTNPFLYSYNVKAQTWSTDNAPAAQAVAWSTRKEAYLLTEPSTGAIWYVGGTSTNGAETNEIDRFLNGAWNANIPVVTNNNNSGGSNVGSTTLMSRFSSGTAHLYEGKMYIFGGFSSGNGPRSYQSFQSLPWIDISTSTPTIGSQLTLGPIPPPRQDHCSVLTDSQKVIVFGGYDANSKTTFSDMWSLDLATLMWQQVIPVTAAEPRYGHTCNIVGANLIVFGGRVSATSSKGEVGYFKDSQVFDVTTFTWMTHYIPKQDTTPVSKPQPGGVGGPGNGSGSSGLSSGALVGIIIGVIAILGSVLAFVVYRRRQQRIEIREAAMEKEAYLASLGNDGEGGEENGGHRKYKKHKNSNSPYAASAGSPHSASTRRLNSAANTPGMSHFGQSGIESPTMLREEELHQFEMATEAPGNMQYLMQRLPDGTIAVQPVYLDHQQVSIQHSPNMIYSETSSLGGFLGATGNNGVNSEGYIAPPLSQHHQQHPHAGVASAGYVPPPGSIGTGISSAPAANIPMPPPVHDPFASPVMTSSPSQWASPAPSSPKQSRR